MAPGPAIAAASIVTTFCQTARAVPGELRGMNGDLFAAERIPAVQPIADGAMWLRAFADQHAQALLLSIHAVLAHAPLRQMQTPGGYRMSVAMSNCGDLGWVTDRRGYRYVETDPLSGKHWPPMPPLLRTLAGQAALLAGFRDFVPDACLINCYAPGAKMSLHQDRNERDFTQPIVSLSLGLPATFLFGGAQRTDKPVRLRLESGDAVVWGGSARLRFHGIDTLADGDDALTGRCRFNLTMRRAR